LRFARKLTAPLSVVLLIVVAGLAFTQLQTRPEIPPPILDPQFDLWVSDAAVGGQRPLVWGLGYVKGPEDKVELRETTLEGRRALEIRILQDGVDDEWAYVYLNQTIDGARLRALYTMELGVWVLTELSCACKAPTTSQSTVFGLEIDDSAHGLTFIFSPERMAPQQFLAHRTIYLETVAGTWTYHRIDIAKEYRNAHWSLPERITFSIVLGAPGSASGVHIGYVHGFAWIAKRTTTSAQIESEKSTSLTMRFDTYGFHCQLNAPPNSRVEGSGSQGFNR